MSQGTDNYVHVAAAAIFHTGGRILLSLRPDHAHQGGLWEFPGGKLEPGEPVADGLYRELHEELHIEPESARPLIRVRHDYGDRRVLLDVWRVDRYRGTPQPVEGQRLAWVAPEQLPEWPMPAADIPIVNAVRLPDCYLIAEAPGGAGDRFLERLRARVEAGIRLVQLRAHHMPAGRFATLAEQAVRICQRAGAALLLNAKPELVAATGAAGVHLPAWRACGLQCRPLPDSYWVGVSCHDPGELDHAVRIGADFAVLSPVAATPSHPDVAPLGWQRFQEFTDQANLPVFALGGMTPDHLPEAFRRGAQGIAAARGLWGDGP